MNTDWNFDTIGKRMPYTAPAECFTQLENDTWHRIESKRNRHHFRPLRTILRAVVTLAAVVAIIVVWNHDFSGKPVKLSDINEAFDKLSVEDQDYLLETYQDDLFINK